MEERKPFVVQGYGTICTSETYPKNRKENVDRTSLEISRSEEIESINITRSQKTLFGLGHIFNDLCAAMWFSYTLLFMQVVLEMESTTAGAMLLLGQVIDALATPVVGILADKWGNKKQWHVTGTILVLFSFPLIFTRCIGCIVSPERHYLTWWMPVYYAVVITMFQCGWAIVQISHLSMIPSLSSSFKERSELTAIRYTASVCSSITVYLVTWSVLHSANFTNKNIGPVDDYKFRNIASIITAIGISLSILFHIGFQISNFKNSDVGAEKEKRVLQSKISGSAAGHLLLNKEVKNFLKSPMLYHVSLLYVASRLYGALSLVYVPLFLDERLNLNYENSNEGVEAVASIPLVTYISSFFASLALKYRSKVCGNELTYFVGTIASIISCLWIALFMDPTSGSLQLYLVAALIGAGSSVTMVSSLCITADLIGTHSNQGAEVYSIVTFTDKLVTGIAVIVIEHLKCVSPTVCPHYYRDVLAYACGGSAALGLLVTLLGVARRACPRYDNIQRTHHV